MTQPPCYAEEALRARRLWGIDQAGYDAAIAAELAMRYPHRAGAHLNELAPNERMLVIEGAVQRHRADAANAEIQRRCRPITEHQLRAALVLLRHGTPTPAYLVRDGISPWSCSITGYGGPPKSCTLATWYDHRQSHYSFPLSEVYITEETAAALDLVVAQQRFVDACQTRAAGPRGGARNFRGRRQPITREMREAWDQLEELRAQSD